MMCGSRSSSATAARLPHQLLPAPQLGVEGHQPPCGRVLVEAGAHPHGVRQPGHRGERLAVVVVDEQHV
jgi:hypothetical protein